MVADYVLGSFKDDGRHSVGNVRKRYTRWPGRNLCVGLAGSIRSSAAAPNSIWRSEPRWMGLDLDQR